MSVLIREADPEVALARGGHSQGPTLPAPAGLPHRDDPGLRSPQTREERRKEAGLDLLGQRG